MFVKFRKFHGLHLHSMYPCIRDANKLSSFNIIKKYIYFYCLWWLNVLINHCMHWTKQFWVWIGLFPPSLMLLFYELLVGLSSMGHKTPSPHRPDWRTSLIDICPPMDGVPTQQVPFFFLSATCCCNLKETSRGSLPGRYGHLGISNMRPCKPSTGQNPNRAVG